MFRTYLFQYLSWTFDPSYFEYLYLVQIKNVKQIFIG